MCQTNSKKTYLRRMFRSFRGLKHVTREVGKLFERRMRRDRNSDSIIASPVISNGTTFASQCRRRQLPKAETQEHLIRKAIRCKLYLFKFENFEILILNYKISYKKDAWDEMKLQQLKYKLHHNIYRYKHLPIFQQQYYAGKFVPPYRSMNKQIDDRLNAWN